MNKFSKTSLENTNATFDFSGRLGTSEGISTVVVSAVALSTNTDATTTVVASNSNTSGIVTVNFKAGTSGEEYNVLVGITTNSNPARYLQENAFMEVEDLDYVPTSRNLRTLRKELRSILSKDDSDALWLQSELDYYISKAYQYLWVWMQDIAPKEAVVRKEDFELVASAIEDAPQHALPTSCYAIKSLKGHAVKYPAISETEADNGRRGWWREAIDGANVASKFFVSKIDSGANQTLDSRDLSGSAWTLTDCNVNVNAVVCIDRTARITNTLTAGAANATATQTLSLSSDYYTFATYMKRKTGTGTISLTLDGGSTWTAKTLTNTWARYSVSGVNTDPVIGYKIATSGDEIYVDSAELRTPDLALLRYTAAPDYIDLDSETPSLPPEVFDFLVPVAAVWARQKEGIDFVEAFSELEKKVKHVIHTLLPRENKMFEEDDVSVYNGTYSGFEA